MTIKVALNGYGRIGRNALRALYENQRHQDMKIVAINDLGDIDSNAHLTRYDTTHGRFSGEISVDGEDMVINGDRIRVLSESDPARLPWKQLGVDVVLECTGVFKNRDQAEAHLQAGARKVLVSAPGKGMDATVVYGVNHETLGADDVIISNASCTTNCLAPLAKVLNDGVGIEHGLMTTTHSYTNDQVLADVYHKDLHRARSATQSQIPTQTGAAAAVGLVLPELDGRLDGMAVRVPTLNVSLVDLTFTASRDTSTDEINQLLYAATQSGPLSGIMAYNEEPLVSMDFNHTPYSSVVETAMNRVQGKRLVKACAWYDNEWAFSNRMLDTAHALASAK